MTNFQHILTSPATPSTLGDKLTLSLTTLIFGMLTVFAVLLIIMIVLNIIGSFFKRKDMKAKEQAAAKQEQVAVVAEPAAEEIAEQEDEEQIIAAITAAVALCMEEPIGSFRVVSFKKTATKTAWNKK